MNAPNDLSLKEQALLVYSKHPKKLDLDLIKQEVQSHKDSRDYLTIKDDVVIDNVPMPMIDVKDIPLPPPPGRQASDNQAAEIESHANVTFRPSTGEVTCNCSFNLFRWRRNHGHPK